MMLGIGERQRLGRFGDQADKALALAHCRKVNRLAVQAFGCEKFKPPVGAQNIDRADFGHHVRGDEDDDLVQPILRADLLGHDLAQPPQQLPRTARRCRAYGLPFSGPEASDLKVGTKPHPLRNLRFPIPEKRPPHISPALA